MLRMIHALVSEARAKHAAEQQRKARDAALREALRDLYRNSGAAACWYVLQTNLFNPDLKPWRNLMCGLRKQLTHIHHCEIQTRLDAMTKALRYVHAHFPDALNRRWGALIQPHTTLANHQWRLEGGQVQGCGTVSFVCWWKPYVVEVSATVDCTIQETAKIRMRETTHWGQGKAAYLANRLLDVQPVWYTLAIPALMARRQQQRHQDSHTAVHALGRHPLFEPWLLRCIRDFAL